MAINTTTLSADFLSMVIYEVDTLADDKILYKFTDVNTSGILYENPGYATDSFAAPDATATGITTTTTIAILAPTLGGDIQISVKRRRAGVNTTVNYAQQKTGGGEISSAYTSVVDCVLATLTVTDTTSYPSGVTSFFQKGAWVLR